MENLKRKVYNQDLTIIFYTANSFENKLSAGVRENLLKVAGNYPIISVSQKPMDFGNKNICVGNIGKSPRNLYRQILIGAKAAKTEYVAMAEDDCLYTKEHFKACRPDNAFGYNMAKWSFYTWVKPPLYSLKPRKTTSAMIAPRKLLIEALEERYAKYPDDNNYPIHYWGEVGRYEQELGVTVRPTVEYWTYEPIVMFSHENALNFESLGARKRHGVMRAYDVAYWGKAEDLKAKYIC